VEHFHILHNKTVLLLLFSADEILPTALYKFVKEALLFLAKINKFVVRSIQPQ